MKKLYILLLAATTTLISCGDKQDSSAGASQESVKVATQTISTNPNGEFLSSSGIIEAVNSASLSTRMMGFVDRIPVKTGDRVSKGTLLISINNADLSAKQAQANAAIAQAQAALSTAETDYKRFQALFEDNSASKKELDDMEAMYNMAKAQFDAANEMKNEVNAQFAYSNLRAPFSGVVTGVFTDVGDMANPGVPLVTIEAPSAFEVSSRISESDISKINMDKPVSVVIKSIDTTVTAKITELSTSSAKTGGQFLVKAILDEKPSKLRSGMYATVLFPSEVKESEGNIKVPVEAIVNRGQLTGIYTVSQQQTAVLRWIRLGETLGGSVEVLSGLTAGETIIVSSEGKLYNGLKIETE